MSPAVALPDPPSPDTRSAGPEAIASEATPAAAHPDPQSYALRITLIFLAWNAAMWAAIGALVHPYLPGGWVAVAVGPVITTAPLLVFLRGMGTDATPSAATRILILRPFWYTQLALPLLAVAGGAGALAGVAFDLTAAGGQGAIAATGSVLLIAFAVGFAGTRRLVRRDLELAHPDLPDGLDGFRIVQLSDLHVGPHTNRGFLARIARTVRDARPDLIVHTGDQVDDHAPDVHHFLAAFGDLAAPSGVIAIPGNHDVYAGWTHVHRGLEAGGITVLVNDATPREHNGARFWVAGTGDPAGNHWPQDGGQAAAPDIPRTLERIPDGAFTLALAHNPALWPALAARGVALTLSGHTHHGQFSIPGLGWCLASPFLEHAMGHHVSGRSALYINPGTNYWGIPLRIGAWPEVTVVTLRKARGGDSTRVLSETVRTV